MSDDERRLWALEALCDPLTLRVLDRLRLSRQSRCLELGAGRGSIARWLATQCLHGSVVATDTDTRYLRELREPNLQVQQHDIADGPDFPTGSFDLIHSRALFVHLPDREAILARVARWLAPGGWLVVEEPALFPADSTLEPAVGAAVAAFERLMADRLGSDFRWPRRLPASLHHAGLAEVDMSAALAVTSDRGAVNEFWRINLTSLGGELVDTGLLDPLVLRAALSTFDDPGYRDLTLAFVCAWGSSQSSQPSQDVAPTTGSVSTWAPDPAMVTGALARPPR
ncbi:MAG TPA: class I SAM-dependent methyltransferase [Pseudonocardiaceae bacterium]|nr:class I SAM-dependent methyltransferase [Pseudonocardiaceae bacterium]